ncbi:MAG: cytochrome b/b6 domain-containing protein [Nitrospinae bacterium]|nr:cytochrome b/b6 domain-containing protein [Nitrospinota bacterium]
MRETEKTSRVAAQAELEEHELYVIRYTSKQRLLHWTHTLAFLGLMGTGFLLLPYGWQPFEVHPRERIGGYSFMLRDWHEWLAIAFIVIPTLLLLAFLVERRGKAPEESRSGRGPTEVSQNVSRARWLNLAKRAHLVWSIGMASAFVLTGSIMWASRDYFSDRLVEWAFTIHDILTYVSIPLMLGHFAILHLLGALDAMQGMVLGKVRREWAESVAPPDRM